MSDINKLIIYLNKHFVLYSWEGAKGVTLIVLVIYSTNNTIYMLVKGSIIYTAVKV